MEYTLNCKGRLFTLAEPQVMGILNVTPDSFYADSRKQTEREIAERTQQILQEGGSIVDVGACSTRPDSEPVGEQEEMDRLRLALSVVCHEAPDAVVSVDTFRPDVARMAVEEFGVDIINDVGFPSSLPQPRESMWRMVSRLRVPYIFMSRKASVREVMLDCAEAVDTLRSMGQKDIVLDPMKELDRMQMLGLPLLVGISRKSMVYRLLGSQQEEALNGTTVLNTLALMKGASILRVHDVREAVECVKIVLATNKKES